MVVIEQASLEPECCCTFSFCMHNLYSVFLHLFYHVRIYILNPPHIPHEQAPARSQLGLAVDQIGVLPVGREGLR